jgi:hypothetical protein
MQQQLMAQKQFAINLLLHQLVVFECRADAAAVLPGLAAG